MMKSKIKSIPTIIPAFEELIACFNVKKKRLEYYN